MKKIIEVENLRKSFEDLIAVDGITFNIRKGEIFGFLGPNAAGKTTTIRLLTGILTPDAGTARISGIDIAKNPIGAKLKFGVIPETGNIYVDLTAEQNIMLSGKFYGIPRERLKTKAASLLKKFDIYGRKDEPVRKFSKGLKQRVSIASALVHDPDILFLDEPTSGLDVISQRLIRGFIMEMKTRGKTVFLTTHNIEEANRLSERVAILKKGKIVAIDRPENLKKNFESVQSVEVSFNELVSVNKFDNCKAISKKEKSGDRWKLYTDNPDSVIKYLNKLADKEKLKFISLNILKPSLENVFVKYTEGENE
ncbi:MAG: ABC transporter ATP-binding protein [Elusimicrobiota bacterium]